jgi:cytidylate kinase
VLLTLSGLPGSGTSTLARRVAAELGIERLDGGSVFRALAAEQHLDLAEYARLAEHDEAIDRALDERLTDRARQGTVLLESRLSGWLVHRAALGGYKVWLACGEVERARRVAEREDRNPSEALAHNQAREASERVRYRGYYGIDLADLTIYDLVLDSTERSPSSLETELLAGVRASSAP